MVPMRDSGIVEAFHEPSLRPRPRSRTRPRPANLVSRTRTRTRTRTIGFMVPMRDAGIVEAFHEPRTIRRLWAEEPCCTCMRAFGAGVVRCGQLSLRIFSVPVPRSGLSMNRVPSAGFGLKDHVVLACELLEQALFGVGNFLFVFFQSLFHVAGSVNHQTPEQLGQLASQRQLAHQ